MQYVRFLPGTHIAEAAARLCQAADGGGSARCHFNDIELRAVAGDRPEKIIAAFDAAMEAARVAYLNSPQKKIDDERRNAQVARLQETHDNLMRDLTTLDWSSDVAVLDWLCAMQEPSDHIDVIRRHHDILAAFEAHGFKPNVNIGDGFDGEDRDNYFRYVVGQALSTMEFCAIHGMVHEFTKRWKAKFEPGQIGV